MHKKIGIVQNLLNSRDLVIHLVILIDLVDLVNLVYLATWVIWINLMDLVNLVNLLYQEIWGGDVLTMPRFFCGFNIVYKGQPT